MERAKSEKSTMIFLKDENLLFLKPFKVAGTSFEIALSKFAGPNDIISPLRRDDHIRRKLGFPSHQNCKYTWHERFSMPPKRQLKLLYYKHEQIKYPQHTSAQMARDFLGKNVFEQAFKVSIVRNPFDYLISHYFWHNRDQDQSRQRFDAWVKRNPWIINRNDQFYSVDGHEIVDFYIRFENFTEDIEKLEARKPGLKGLANTFSGITAKAGVRPDNADTDAIFRDHPLLVQAIQFFQGHHIQRFGYSPPPAFPAETPAYE